MSSCAHVGEGDEPLAMAERVIREACIPFVVDGVDADEVRRRLGGLVDPGLAGPIHAAAGTDIPAERCDGADHRRAVSAHA